MNGGPKGAKGLWNVRSMEGLGRSLGFAYMADVTVKDEVAPGLHDMRRVLLPPGERFWTVRRQDGHRKARLYRVAELPLQAAGHECEQTLREMFSGPTRLRT